MSTNELLYVTVGSGETLSGAVWDSGASVTVAAGGKIVDVSLGAGASGMTLAQGAVLAGSITVSAPVAVEGDVNAADARIIWDISQLKEEAALILEDYSAVSEATEWGISVNPNQDK